MTGTRRLSISPAMPLGVHVVIPAHNEAELIGRCLRSVEVSAAQLGETAGLPITVTVVADSCTDTTVEVAERHGADVLQIDVHGVGLARDAGVRHVLTTNATLDASRVWIAMTDADSTVPATWLQKQLRSATEGFDVVIGPVRPDPVGMSPAVVREWWARHRRPCQLHVHGPNLGFTAAALLRAGGSRPSPSTRTWRSSEQRCTREAVGLRLDRRCGRRAASSDGPREASPATCAYRSPNWTRPDRRLDRVRGGEPRVGLAAVSGGWRPELHSSQRRRGRRRPGGRSPTRGRGP
jgi:hypothetical protein